MQQKPVLWTRDLSGCNRLLYHWANTTCSCLGGIGGSRSVSTSRPWSSGYDHRLPSDWPGFNWVQFPAVGFFFSWYFIFVLFFSSHYDFSFPRKVKKKKKKNKVLPVLEPGSWGSKSHVLTNYTIEPRAQSLKLLTLWKNRFFHEEDTEKHLTKQVLRAGFQPATFCV